MRSWILIALLGSSLAACTKGGEEAGREAARKQAEEEAKKQAAELPAVKTVKPPVPGGATLPCSQVIDPNTFQQAIGEVEPVTVKSTKIADTAAACTIVRGGKRLTIPEQEALRKKQPRLGVLAGDDLCTVSLYCYTIEDPDKFLARCKERKRNVDESLGFPACVQIFAQGADDVKHFQFYDSDTKCIIDVGAGPSNTDNELIGKCAKAAHDLIGPDQIKVGGAPAAPAAPEGSGSGS